MLEIQIVNNINQYLKNNGIPFSNETRMGIGIPDISCNIGTPYHLTLIDDYFLLSILEFVNKKHFTSLHEIKNEFLMTIKKVKHYVIELANMSFVKLKNDIVEAIINIFSTKLGTVISIEAKIRDWKNAYLQAQRYLCFSDYSYIAMPSIYIKNIEKDSFIKSGIGIISVEDGKVEEVLPARKSDLCEFTLKYLITSKIMKNNTELKKSMIKSNIFSSLFVV
jgi:hypothetical protein